MKKPCLVGQIKFVIMDKFVTFMGYLQNFVTPSRRNQSRELASASSETRNHAKNEAYRLPQEKSHPRAGQNIRKAFSGRGFDSKTEGSTGGDFKWKSQMGPLRETKYSSAVKLRRRDVSETEVQKVRR